jgi:hypothetical protein
MAYWREVRREAWQRAKVTMASRERRMFSIAAPLVSAAIVITLLLVLRQPIPLAIIVTVISALGGYGVLVVWEWLHQLLIIPAEREQTLLTQLREKEAVLSAPPTEPIRIEFTHVQFLVSDQNTSMAHMNVNIHNTGQATTLHKWRLQSKLYGEIAALTNINIGDQPRPELVEIGERKVKVGSLSFKIRAPMEQVQLNNEWWLEFSDVAGRVYKEALPPESYQRA